MLYQVKYFLKKNMEFQNDSEMMVLQKILVKFLLIYSYLKEPANEYSHPNMVLNLKKMCFRSVRLCHQFPLLWTVLIRSHNGKYFPSSSFSHLLQLFIYESGCLHYHLRWVLSNVEAADTMHF